MKMVIYYYRRGQGHILSLESGIFTAGGGAKSGENSKDAVLREFKEETGLDCDLIIDEPFAVGRTADWLIVYYAQVVNRAKFAKCETMNSDEVS